MKDLIKKFELNIFLKEISYNQNDKEIFWNCFSNFFFVNCIVLLVLFIVKY